MPFLIAWVLQGEMNKSIEASDCTGVTPSSYSETELDYATAVTTSVIIAISAVFSTVANGLVMFVLIRKNLLNSPLHFLLANMCLIDIVIGTISQPLFVAMRIKELSLKQSCILKQSSAFLGYFSGGMTVCILCLISLDRWVAIAMPFRYESMVTRRICVALLALSCLICTGATLSRSLNIVAANIYYLAVSFLLIGLTLQALFCYAKIYMIARKHERKIDFARRVQLSTEVSAENGSNTNSVENSGEASSRKKRACAISQRRKSKTVVYMALLLAVCYLPKAIIIMDAFLFRNSDSMLYAALKWSETLFFLNSSFNPIIYCLRMAYIRNEVWKMFETLIYKLRCG